MKLLVIFDSDPELMSSWSGVPCHFLRAARTTGHICVSAYCDDVLWIKIPRVIYNRIWRQLFHKNECVQFGHGWLGMKLMSLWLRRQVARTKPEAVIAFSYEYNATGITVPVVLIHDWFNGKAKAEKTPELLTWGERRQLAIQVACVKASTFSVSLYPSACDWMKTLCGDKMRYFGNPVNVDFEPDADEWTRERISSRHILCIGGNYYRENVETVIKAVGLLREKNRDLAKDIEIDVIGVKDVPHPADIKVNFYGYLDKNDAAQGETYRALLRKARCVVNVRTGWGGGSSIVEAMYCYCPVIIGDYPDMVAAYGKEESFGRYCAQGDSIDCSRVIAELMMLNEEYVGMCRSAHQIQAQMTYPQFINTLERELKV